SGRLLAEPQHELRAVHAVRQLHSMQPIQCPAHRLAIRHQHVEVVQPPAVHRVEYAGHQTVNGERRNDEWFLLPRGPDGASDRGIIVDGTDLNSQYVVPAEVDHRATDSSKGSVTGSVCAGRPASVMACR